MTDPRAEIFAAFRKAKSGIFADSGNVLALDNLCDAYGIPRADAVRLRRLAQPENFFAKVRTLTGSLDAAQVATINSLLAGASHWSTGWIAYGFATAWHECKLRPIHELGGPNYLKKYDTGELAKRLGNTPEADGDGILYAGRGLVQLTGRANYENAGKFLGLDLLGHPDLALEPDNAARILVWGMETGAFTGKKLADYIKDRGESVSFASARRIINGTDKASLIASYAVTFQSALDAGGWA